MRIYKLSLCLLISVLSFPSSASGQLIIERIPEINRAKIIAFGESAHGVEEFNSFKTETFKELVELGITKTFIIETNYSEAYIINDYIQHRKKFSMDSLMIAGLYPVWRTPEMAKLIKWMYHYNSTKPQKDHLSFIGIDAQSAKMAVHYVTSDLQKLMPDFKTKLPKDGIKLIKEMGATRDYNIKQLTSEQQQSLVETVKELRYLLNQARSDSPLNLHMKVIEQSLEFEQASMFNFTNIRDSHMAEIVMEITEAEETKDQAIFLWAHNGHISKSKSLLYKPLGFHIYRKLEEKYLVIGLDFFEGEIRNTYKKGYTNYEALSGKNWIGHLISSSAEDISLFNMAEIAKVKIRNIGAGDGTLKTKGKRDFDYLFYFRKVHPAQDI